MIEEFCLACVAAPLALLTTSFQSTLVDKNSLQISAIKRQHTWNRCFMYGTIFIYFISLIFTLYFINGGCKECS